MARFGLSALAWSVVLVRATARLPLRARSFFSASLLAVARVRRPPEAPAVARASPAVSARARFVGMARATLGCPRRSSGVAQNGGLHPLKMVGRLRYAGRRLARRTSLDNFLVTSPWNRCARPQGEALGKRLRCAARQPTRQRPNCLSSGSTSGHSPPFGSFFVQSARSGRPPKAPAMVHATLAVSEYEHLLRGQRKDVEVGIKRKARRPTGLGRRAFLCP